MNNLPRWQAARLAQIAGCTTRTMERWMSRNESPQLLKQIYLRRLGEFWFLLHYHDQFPRQIWDAFCSLDPENPATSPPPQQ